MSSDITPFNDQVIVLLRADDELYEQLTSQCDFQGRQLINFNSDDEMFDAWDEKKFNAVAIISKSDVLGKYGVNLINYWVDEKNGTVMCLAQAPDSAALIKTHKEAHGLIPVSVMLVKQGQ